MSDNGFKGYDNTDATRWANTDATRWAISEHRSDVLDMARAVASGWDWSITADCVAIGRIAAAIVAAVDDALDGDA